MVFTFHRENISHVYMFLNTIYELCVHIYIYNYIRIHIYIYHYIILICIHFVSKMDAPWDWNNYLAYTFLVDLKTIHVGVYSRFTERKGNLRQFKSFFCHPPCIYIYIYRYLTIRRVSDLLPSGKLT